MESRTYEVWKGKEYNYPVKGSFIPNLVSYIHDEDKVTRPAILIVPGGGYQIVSNTEGEIVAKEFYEKGYNTFVLSYTVNLSGEIPLEYQPLKDISRAVVFLRKNAAKFKIKENQIAICGFSAGGHLCGSLAVHYDVPELKSDGEYQGISNRPDAAILCYPVITSGQYAHKGSFAALLGEDVGQEELDYMSLEKHVNSHTPPVFLWHTITDETVPVENSYLFSEACKNQGVPYEMHLFAKGPHGLSLANAEWASGEYGGDYTMNQFFEYMQYHIDNEIIPPSPLNEMQLSKGEDFREFFRKSPKYNQKQKKPNPSVAVWPELVHHWLTSLYKEENIGGN